MLYVLPSPDPFQIGGELENSRLEAAPTEVQRFRGSEVPYYGRLVVGSNSIATLGTRTRNRTHRASGSTSFPPYAM